jgi:hypothetical protein
VQETERFANAVEELLRVGLPDAACSSGVESNEFAYGCAEGIVEPPGPGMSGRGSGGAMILSSSSKLGCAIAVA